MSRDDNSHDGEMLDDFVAQLESARTASEMETILSSWLDRLGIRYFTYHVFLANHAMTTYPKRWVQHYISSHYFDEDPIVGEAMRRRLPFLWSEVGGQETLSRRQLNLMEEARDAGVANGLTIPISRSGVDVAGLSVVPDAGDTSGVAALVGRRLLLELMALHFDRQARRRLREAKFLGSTRRHSLLSPRELEVLEWIGRGKSTWEIAQILRISAKGIEFHVENAKRKLQVFGRTHAVVKALMLGLISPE
jgi:DNA-binding CsgD family transcriptional regulator